MATGGRGRRWAVAAWRGRGARETGVAGGRRGGGPLQSAGPGHRVGPRTMEPVAGAVLGVLFLLSVERRSAVLARDTCEYRASLETCTNNLQFVVVDI